VSPREDADVLTSSEAYARRFAGPVGEWFLEVQARATLDLVAAWPGASVLDVGGGHAQTALPLARAGHPVTVLGSEPSSGERLLRLLAASPEAGRVRFQAGDLLQAPFPDLSFDVVVSYRLLPHVAHWPQLVAELARLARQAVVVDYPTVLSVNALAEPLFAWKKRVEGDTRPFRVFRDGEVTAAFAAHGLRPTGRRPQFFWPMALHRALGTLPLSRGLEALTGLLGLRRLFGSPVIARFER
jgi:SAM-dependent methyltransferase